MNFISMLNGFLFHFKDLFPTHRDLTVNHQRSWSTFAAIQHWLYSTDKTDMPETNSRRYHETKSLWVNPCSLPEYEFHQQSMLNAILSHFKEFFPHRRKNALYGFNLCLITIFAIQHWLYKFNGYNGYTADKLT